MKETATKQTAPRQTSKPRNGCSAGPEGVAFSPLPYGIACLDTCRNTPAPVQRRIEDEEEPLQGKFTAIQRAGDVPINDDPALEKEADLMGARALQAKSADSGQNLGTAQPPAPNRTGLPDGLKSGVEALSGLSLDNVRVHYNSDRPARLQAYAYTQGSDIHVAPGQERHLAHEAWHVVQQMEGRVRDIIAKPSIQAVIHVQAGVRSGWHIHKNHIRRNNEQSIELLNRTSKQIGEAIRRSYGDVIHSQQGWNECARYIRQHFPRR